MSVDKLPKPTRVALIGSGTIGLSFAALHLTQSPNVEVAIYDTRPDLKAYIEETLPGPPAPWTPHQNIIITVSNTPRTGYLATLSPTHSLPDLLSSRRLTLSP
ncbi:hypothetical protein EMPG_15091, partial [Blastomyces silverae]